MLSFNRLEPMTERIFSRALSVLFGCALAFSGLAGETATNDAARPIKPFTPVHPGVLDGRIAYVAARILEQVQMQKHPFDDAISQKFFDKYLEALDPQHLHFTQQDLSNFDKYRTRLDNLTISSKFLADTSPAAEIFNTYMKRLEQRINYSKEL